MSEIFDNILYEQWDAEFKVQEALDSVEEKELLMSEFITESAPSALRELKNKKNTVAENEDISKQQAIQKLIRSKISDHKTLYMNSLEIRKYKYGEEAYDLIRSLCEQLINEDPTAFKKIYMARKKFFNIIGIKNGDKRVLVVRKGHGFEYEIDISWEAAELHMYKRTPSTRFFHFSKEGGLTHLDPTAYTPAGKFANDFIYPKPRVYLFAVDESNYNGTGKSRVTWAKSTYGSHIYEYIPSPMDKFYIDKAEDAHGKGQPVFINTLSSLKVKEITNEELYEFSKSQGDGKPDSRFTKHKIFKPNVSTKQHVHDIIELVVKKCDQTLASVVKSYNDELSRGSNFILTKHGSYDNFYTVLNQDFKGLKDTFMRILREYLTYIDQDIQSERDYAEMRIMSRLNHILSKAQTQYKLLIKRARSILVDRRG